jgi:hypothetical protein
VRRDALTWLEGEFLVDEEDLDLVRLEGDEVGDACDLGPRLRVVPGRPFVVTDVVLACQPLVGQNVCPSAGTSALSSMSSRGTYQRGAKPDSYSTTRRLVSAIGLTPSLITRWRELWRMSMR